MLHLPLRSLGPVAPLRHPEPGEHVLGQLEHGRFRHRTAPFGDRLVVLLAQSLAHGAHTLDGELRDGALFLG